MTVGFQTRDLTVLFTIQIGDVKASILTLTDGTAFLYWKDDFNDWCEKYDHVSQALARLALLQECAETNFEKGFSASAEHFVSDWNQFVQRQIS